jgi:hypothetical protein
MEDHVDLGETRAAYKLLDIREMDSRTLMASGRPGDLALAMLADGGPEQVAQIARRAARFEGAERQRILSQLVVLSGLRRLSGQLTMELNAMGITTDPFYRHPLVKKAMRDDRAKMIRAMLETKFGKLPKWVDERLAKAKSDEIESWEKKLLKAGTLEGVLGKANGPKRLSA